MNKPIRFFSILLILFLLIPLCAFPASAKMIPLEGKGTESNPYLIQSPQDLLTLRKLVDGGNKFKGCYVLQTVDLDLGECEETKLWDPIGGADYNGSNFFAGTYNGGGHVIRNLNVDTSVAGLFSFLAGTVMNLGIESGHIKGDYAGAFTSHANGGSAQIINCYSLATVSAIRAGGIADNFHGGSIIDSWSAATVNGSEAQGALISYGATNIINSFSVGEVPPTPENSVVFSLGVYSLSADAADLAALVQATKDNTLPHNDPIKQKTSIAKGDGTAEDPYQIENAEQLRSIAFWVNLGIGTNFYNTYFLQTADIDMTDCAG